ncbi:mitochondrial import receptor subunit TOM40-1 [Trifolium repens]|nr:mitochondrial import receptor subunit TOM40-1 [Trifolium repens]
MISAGPTFAQSKTDVFRLIWKSKAPSKVTAFVWQLLLDKSQRDTIYCLGEWHCRFCPEVVCFVKLRSKIQGTSFCTCRLRGKVDSNGVCAAYLEERLNMGLNFILSEELDHKKKDYKFGFGLELD